MAWNRKVVLARIIEGDSYLPLRRFLKQQED